MIRMETVMLKRIITSIVALFVLVPVLIFSDISAYPILGWLFPIGIAACTVIAICEMAFCIGLKKQWYLYVPVSLAGVFFPIFIRYLAVYSPDRSSALLSLLKLAMGIAFIMALYIFGVAVFGHEKVGIQNAGLFFATSFYIIAAFCSIVYIYDFVNHGKYLYLLTFICAWMTDIFAYFTGRLFGKHKLIPAVSPKKTVEGAVGGVVFCVISTVVFGLVIEKLFNANGDISANYLVIAISGIFISVVSQTGDLIMSVIKRHYGIKDYGKLFPGHGGILDRFDSVMAVALIMAFICTYFDMLTTQI